MSTDNARHGEQDQVMNTYPKKKKTAYVALPLLVGGLCALMLTVATEQSGHEPVPEVAALTQSAAIDIASFEALLGYHAQWLEQPGGANVGGDEQAFIQQERAQLAAQTLEQLQAIKQNSSGIYEIQQVDHPELYRIYLLFAAE